MRIAPNSCAVGGIFGLLTGVVLLISCQPDSKKKETVAAAPAATANATADAPGTWYQQYRSLLPGTTDSVTIHLQSIGRGGDDVEIGRVVGYYTGADGRPFELLSNPSNSPDSLTLREAGPALGADGNNREMLWHLRREGNQWVGNRAGQPIRLRRLVPGRGVAFSTQLFQDSILPRANHPADSVRGRISLHALLPTKDGRVTFALRGNILRALRGDTVFSQSVPTLPTIWAQRRHAFARDYQQEVGAQLQQQEKDPAARQFRASLNYDDEQSTYVLWNEGNLLSLGFFAYEYLGGAHGGYHTRVLSFDTRTGQPLGYNDIFQVNSEARLETLLTQYARPSLGLKPNEPLTNALFENSLPTTRNVFLTSGGVVFVYAPYEIASFAQGEIRIFVPLSALRSVLRPGLPVAPEGRVAKR